MGGNVGSKLSDSEQNEAKVDDEEHKNSRETPEEIAAKAFPSFHIHDVVIEQIDVDYASSSFHIIMSGFWTAPFMEKKKDPQFRHNSTTTWFYEVFYEDFFRTCPEVRPLFATVSMFTQGRLLVGSLSLALDVLSNRPLVHTRLTNLTNKHNELGVRCRYYKFFGDSLMIALEIVLGPLLDEPTLLAWKKLYSYMLNFMVPIAVEYESKL